MKKSHLDLSFNVWTKLGGISELVRHNLLTQSEIEKLDKCVEEALKEKIKIINSMLNITLRTNRLKELYIKEQTEANTKEVE